MSFFLMIFTTFKKGFPFQSAKTACEIKDIDHVNILNQLDFAIYLYKLKKIDIENQIFLGVT